jgi:hypothetical protein
VPLKLLHQLRLHAEGAGLNLFGLVDRARFDACEPRERRIDALVPACGTVLVLGSGSGRSASSPLIACHSGSTSTITTQPGTGGAEPAAGSVDGAATPPRPDGSAAATVEPATGSGTWPVVKS